VERLRDDVGTHGIRARAGETDDVRVRRQGEELVLAALRVERQLPGQSRRVVWGTKDPDEERDAVVGRRSPRTVQQRQHLLVAE
jgi:hypothetical protein